MAESKQPGDDVEPPIEMLRLLHVWRDEPRNVPSMHWPTRAFVCGPALTPSMVLLGPVSFANATSDRVLTLVKHDNLIQQLRLDYCVWQFVDDGRRGTFQRGMPVTINPKSTVTVFFFSPQCELSIDLVYQDQRGSQVRYQMAALAFSNSVPRSWTADGIGGLFTVGLLGSNVMINDRLGIADLPAVIGPSNAPAAQPSL